MPDDEILFEDLMNLSEREDLKFYLKILKRQSGALEKLENRLKSTLDANDGWNSLSLQLFSDDFDGAYVKGFSVYPNNFVSGDEMGFETLLEAVEALDEEVS